MGTSVVLFMIMVILSFLIVRVGAMAFELTGMAPDQAVFQALSCYTRTGYTTKEAELVTGNPDRRRIASIIIVLGNAASVTLIASLASHIQDMVTRNNGILWIPFTNISYDIGTAWLSTIEVIILGIIIFSSYKFFVRSKMFTKLLNFTKELMSRFGFINSVPFEELLVGIQGHDIIKLRIPPECELCGTKLGKSLFHDSQVKVLAIERKDNSIVTAPGPETEIKGEDLILCFGQRDEALETLKSVCSPKEQ